ncbi:MAG: hypothetical protein AB1427_21035 [Thermodesulfobacteriota bacterium]
MKLLSVHLARSIWLGKVGDLNPTGIKLDKILYPFLIETYKFKKHPLPTDLTNMEKGVLFGAGEFEIDTNLSVGINFTLYSDGFVADATSSTNHSDAFLEDVFNRFLKIFKMPPYESVIKDQIYLSQIFVSTDKSLEILNPKLKNISNFLSDNVETGIKFYMGGLSFWPDQTNKRNPIPFMFERASNVPFSENRYYSAAPLPTDKHIKALANIEEILS